MTEMSLYEGHGVLYLKCHIFSKYLCQNEDVLKKNNLRNDLMTTKTNHRACCTLGNETQNEFIAKKK